MDMKLEVVTVNFAVGSALHAMAGSAHGKARQRKRAGKLSPFLAHLVTTVPAQRSRPPVSAPAARQASRATFGLAALFAWLITAGLGSWMMPGGSPTAASAAPAPAQPGSRHP